jgi:hypothetical protein
VRSCCGTLPRSRFLDNFVVPSHQPTVIGPLSEGLLFLTTNQFMQSSVRQTKLYFRGFQPRAAGTGVGSDQFC